MPFDGSLWRGLDRSGSAATMRNREQGICMFSSRTQEVVGVVEAVRLSVRVIPVLASPGFETAVRLGAPFLEVVVSDRLPPKIWAALLCLLVPAAEAQRRLPCFQGRSPDTDGDPEAPPMIIGVRTNGTKAEPPTIVVSWVTREAGGSRVACGKQAAGTSDFKGR